jgi:polyisoprenoid-binding protein YceI
MAMSSDLCHRIVREPLLGGLLCALGLASNALAQQPTVRYVLDPEHTTVAFLVGHAGYAKVLGQFETVAGEFQFDDSTGTLGALEVVVKTESVQTHHAARDRHLRSADFLNTEHFPEMRFTAASAQRTGDQAFSINGELTLLGVTHTLTLEATVNKSAEYPFGKAYVMGVSARGRFERSAFGMDYGVANGLVGDEVEVLIEIEARRQ